MSLRRRIQPGAWLLILSSFLYTIPLGFLIVALPIYLDSVGLHPELIGTLFTVSGIASAVLLAVFGILADRYGRKPFVVIGSALPVGSYLILAFTTSRPLLLVASAVGGIGLAGGMSGALVTAGFNALLAEKSEAADRTALFTGAEIAWTAGVFLGSLSAGIPLLLEHTAGLSYREAYHIVFLGMVVLGLLATLVVLPVHEDHSAGAGRTQWLPRVSGRYIAWFALVLGALGLGLGFIVQLLPLWFHLRFNVSEAFLGPWYGLAQILAIATLSVAAPISRRLGTVRFIILTQGGASAVLVLMGFAPTVSIALILWMVRGMVMNTSWPVQQAYMMGVVDPRERATASSLTYGAWSIGSALTPPIGGLALGAHLYTLPFVLGGVCYFISIGTFFWFFRDVQPAAEPAMAV